MSQDTTSVEPGVSLIDAILRQTPRNSDDWICPNCWNWRGGLHCTKGVFIAYIGGNMSGCKLFDDQARKPGEEGT